MKLQHALTSVLLAFCCVDGAAGRQAGRHAFQKRQDTTDAATTTDATPTPASSTDYASVSAASSTAAPSSGKPTIKTDPTSTGLTQQRLSTSNSANTLADTRSPTATSQSSNLSASLVPTATARPDELPLTPRITPALGVAGVVLMVSGLSLCLIGIKHKWLYIFLSTAFLAGLAVTVLIIYVMNPPVKDAIQGAYMVAAVLTGVIFGALSLVFKEVTEGLGCLLGGFCLAMWFLVLSPGGLITSTSGRAILIAVFCLAFFSLSFSHITRNYGLIFCTAFAGAQITIVGIDCFSRAGLKEFWIYIWNLNDNEFPIDTRTYPITRGIRVEIACTVIIFLFGVMSQFKLWKVIKERRARKDAERMQDDEDKAQLEAAVGRDIEASNNRELAQWEAVYGDNKDGARVQVDSGVGSSVDSFQEHSGSIRERDPDEIEMDEMPGSSSRRVSKQDKRPAVTVRVASDDDEASQSPQLPTQSEEHLLDQHDLSRTASRRSVRIDSNRTSSDGRDQASIRDFTEPTSAGPAVVPLPFTIPGHETEDAEAVGSEFVLSKGTVGNSVHERRRVPMKQLSLREKVEMDRMLAPETEDDRGSSVAATADEDGLSAPRLSVAPSPYQLDFDKDGLLPPSDDERDRSVSPRRSMIELPLEEEDDEAVERPGPALEHNSPAREKSEPKNQKRRSTVSSHRRSIASRRSLREGGSVGGEDDVSVVGSLKDHLPQKLSKVALTYRTNEWAKHIADADAPEDHSSGEAHSPGIQVDHAFAKEAARPVDIEALKPTESPGPSSNTSQGPSKNPYRQTVKEPQRANSRTTSGTVTPVYAFQRSSSATSLNRQGSNATISGQPRLATQGLRNASAPLMSQPLVESPVEENSAANRNVSSPLGMASSNNLMDQRNYRLERKPTSTSFNALASTPNFNVIAPSDSASARNVRLDDDNISLSERKQLLDEENMTLADRKALMQQQQHETVQSPSFRDRNSRQGTWPVPEKQGVSKNVIYDSHQPKRTNTVDTGKQANMFAQWRQSLQQDAASKQPLLADDVARQAMLSGRRMAEFEQQRQQAERVNRESMMDLHARSGHLHQAHREAMMRMQAKANQRAPQ